KMPHLPVLRAGRSAAVVRAGDLGRMRGANAREHIFVAKKSVAVEFGLGIKTRVMVGVPGGGSCGGAQDRLIETPKPPRTRRPRPRIVTSGGISIAEADDTGAAVRLGRQHGIEREQPEAGGFEKIRINRHRFDFGSSHL